MLVEGKIYTDKDLSDAADAVLEADPDLLAQGAALRSLIPAGFELVGVAGGVQLVKKPSS